MPAQDTSQPEKGQTAPDFCLPDSDGTPVCLKNLKGKWAVLYFYPKDNTSGCTLEAIHFSTQLTAFHKHDLKVTLLSDPDHEVLAKYGVWTLKKLYGREYMGVVRSTFLIDPAGQIADVWRAVKVPGHIEAVLDRLKALQD